MKVALKQIGPTEVATVNGIELSASEEEFAGGSLNAIAERLKNGAHTQNSFPFLIMADKKIAGFLMLRNGQALPDWAPPGVFSLHNFRLSRKIQGRGYGTSAVVLAAHWIADHFPQTAQLMASVNVENLVARNFSRRCGFEDTEMFFAGRLGKEIILSCQISDLLQKSP